MHFPPATYYVVFNVSCHECPEDTASAVETDSRINGNPDLTYFSYMYIYIH